MKGLAFMEDSIPPKRCTRCNETKDINEFRAGRNYCKKCQNSSKGRGIKQCRECKESKKIEDIISVGPRTSYCLQCWEALQGKKKCIGCRNIKDLQEFAEDKSRPDGYEYYCKDCKRENQPKKHAKRLLQRGTKQCISCKKHKDISEFFENHSTRDNIDIYCKQCRAEPKPVKDITRELVELRIDRRRAAKLRSQYGITEDEYRSLFKQQQGLCAICGRPEIKSRTLCVDHNHTTGKVRALLYGLCNNGLGHFEENIDYLLKAIEYLEQHE